MTETSRGTCELTYMRRIAEVLLLALELTRETINGSYKEDTRDRLVHLVHGAFDASEAYMTLEAGRRGGRAQVEVAET